MDKKWAHSISQSQWGQLIWMGLLAMVLLGCGVFSFNLTPTQTVTILSNMTPVPYLGIVSTQVSPIDDMVEVNVPAGKFLMGSDKSKDSLAWSSEQPMHTVFITNFWIYQTEVTNAMYAKCVSNGKCKTPSSTSSNTRKSYYGNSQFDNYPVIHVSWDDAASYCQWALRKLPTEAEWEKAARGTDGRIYPWGNQAPDASLATSGTNDTTAVDSHPAGASPYGALDMAGNVWEWVNDWVDPTYYSSQTTWYNPQGPSSGDRKGLRGGSWNYFQHGDIRVAFRADTAPGKSGDDIGFRCVGTIGY
ncbi:MAG: SUMF1/EgtB/PvdO family nonheme iron enzyme [Anaerolineaceae bacterium]|jgi:formylglycine-generating enzyme required for sulfatase activity